MLYILKYTASGIASFLILLIFGFGWRLCLCVYISQLIHLVRASNRISNLYNGNKLSTAKLLKQEHGHHKLPETFFLVSIILNTFPFNVDLKTHLQEGLLGPKCYGYIGNIDFKTIVNC